MRQSFKKITILFFFIAIVIAVIATNFRIQQSDNLDIRKEASTTNTASMAFLAIPATVMVGQDFKTSIQVNPGPLQSVIGVDLVINFDNTRLQLESITTGTDHTLNTLLPINSSKTFDLEKVKNSANASGELIFGAVAFNPDTMQKNLPQATPFTVADIVFKPVADGSMQLTFKQSTTGLDSNVIALNSANDVLGTVTNASFTINTNPNIPAATITPSSESPTVIPTQNQAIPVTSTVTSIITSSVSPPLPTLPPVQNMAECDACGYCVGRKEPENWDQCRACMYPGVVEGASSNKTLILERNAAGKMIPVNKNASAYFTQLGCLDLGEGSFTDPSAPGGVLNFLLDKLMFPIVGTLSFISLLYGAFLLMSAQDRPEQVNKGKKYIIGAIVGLVFTISVVLIINILAGDIIKIPGFM